MESIVFPPLESIGLPPPPPLFDGLPFGFIGGVGFCGSYVSSSFLS
ncbi:hypothetical protein [Helicobacter sp. 16-1353]|nr:hypothetical protein [Helicobacter sp. 16-1353]